MHHTLGVLALHCQGYFICNSGGCFPLTTQKAAMSVSLYVGVFFSWCSHVGALMQLFFTALQPQAPIFLVMAGSCGKWLPPAGESTLHCLLFLPFGCSYLLILEDPITIYEAGMTIASMSRSWWKLCSYYVKCVMQEQLLHWRGCSVGDTCLRTTIGLAKGECFLFPFSLSLSSFTLLFPQK